MTNIINLNPRSTIEDEACFWLTKIDRKLAAEEKLQFQQWLTTDVAHLKTFMEYARFWDMTEQLKHIGAETLSLDDAVPKTEPRVKDKNYWLMSIAASVVFFMVAVAAMFISPFTSNDETKILYSVNLQADKGAFEQKLPDGSKVILDAKSTLAVTFTNYERKLILTEGNMFIEVAPDASRPLTVIAKGRFFQAIGTAFAVSTKYSENVELIVTEGRVSYGKDEDISAIEKEGNPRVALAGERVVSNQQGFKLSKLPENELSQQLAWRTGFVVFRGEPLEDVVKIISRYTDMTFVIASEAIKHERIIGRFKAGDLDSFLSTLNVNFNVQWQINESTVVLTKNES